MRTEGLCSSGFPEGPTQMGNFPPAQAGKTLPDNTPLFLGTQGKQMTENAGGLLCQALPGEKGSIPRLMCLNTVKQPLRIQISCSKAKEEANQAKVSLKAAQQETQTLSWSRPPSR